MFNVAIIGFGQIAQSYSGDNLLKKYYQYVSHVEVIIDHPLLSLHLVVDSSAQRLDVAKQNYNCPNIYRSILDIPTKIKQEIDILVLATPPEFRLEAIKIFSNLRAIILEKPIAPTFQLAKQVVDFCNDMNILIQVNLWRRADVLFRELADTQLNLLIGDCLVGNVLYGNGILNNGTHMIDLVRMLLGEVASVVKLNTPTVPHELPIKSDFNQNFSLNMYSGACINFSSISYRHFRENSLELIGTHGKLEILNEGLTVRYIQVRPNRSTRDTSELNYDSPIFLQSTVGNALYELYQNLVDSLRNGAPLVSSGASALITTNIVERLMTDHPILHLIDLSS